MGARGRGEAGPVPALPPCRSPTCSILLPPPPPACLAGPARPGPAVGRGTGSAPARPSSPPPVPGTKTRTGFPPAAAPPGAVRSAAAVLLPPAATSRLACGVPPAAPPAVFGPGGSRVQRSLKFSLQLGGQPGTFKNKGMIDSIKQKIVYQMLFKRRGGNLLTPFSASNIIASVTCLCSAHQLSGEHKVTSASGCCAVTCHPADKAMPSA
ncbi:uncharacterized protein PRD47_002303 [Ara ararauna]